MNIRLPFFPFALAVSFATAVFAVPPSGFYVSDGEEEDEDSNVVESFRPMARRNSPTTSRRNTAARDTQRNCCGHFRISSFPASGQK